MISYSKPIENIISNVEKAFMSTNFYWQSGVVIACVVVAFIFYKFLKTAILYDKELPQSQNSNFTTKYLYPLLFPICIIFSLSTGSLIFSVFFKENFLFYTAIQLAALFIFLRFLRIVFNNSLISNFVGFFLIPAILLNILGLLEPTITILDQFAISVGKVRISIYTVIQAFIILSVVFWMAGFLSRKVKNYFSRKNDLKASTKGIITKVVDISIYIAVFLIILRVFGVDMTAFAVIGGAIGVGIGFGLQKIASNFISGIILLMEKSVEIGDIVELDGGNIYGTVTHFGGRYTLIEAVDGKEIMVPNEDFIINKVTNWTYNNNRGRIEINIDIAYGSDIRKAQEIILQSVNEHPRCLNYPASECFITNLGDNGISLVAFFWVSDMSIGRYGPKNDVIITILDRFKEAGISIPFPHREIIIRPAKNISDANIA